MTGQNTRVVHVVISLRPGGLERQVVELVKEQNRRQPGCATVICLDEVGELGDEFVKSKRYKVTGEINKDDLATRAPALDAPQIRQERSALRGRATLRRDMPVLARLAAPPLAGNEFTSVLSVGSARDAISFQSSVHRSQSTVYCINADRSRWPWDTAAVKSIRCKVKGIVGVAHRLKQTVSGEASWRRGISADKDDLATRPPSLDPRRLTQTTCLGKAASPPLADEETVSASSVGSVRETAFFQVSGLKFQVSHDSVVLHAHNLASWQYAILAARGIPGAKVVYTQHGANVHNINWKNRLRMNVLSWFTDEIVAVSESTAKTMHEKYGIPVERIKVIYNGIDVSGKECLATRSPELDSPQTCSRDLREQSVAYPPRADKANISVASVCSVRDNSFVIGSAGRLSPEKNYSLLIKAFHAFVKSEDKEKIDSRAKAQSSQSEEYVSHPAGPDDQTNHEQVVRDCLRGSRPGGRVANNLTLLLVGDGSESGKLESLAKDLGIADRVIFAGYQSDPWPHYQMMDVFCLSSETEGLSISALEAGSCGIPLVLTDVGGCSEITDGQNCGIIVPSGDEKAMTDAFVKLSVDAKLRMSLGEKIKTRVCKHFSLESTVSEYEKLYEETASR